MVSSSRMVSQLASGFNKSLQDAAFGQFRHILEYIAWKLGKRLIKVSPKGTSPHFWECLNKVSKSLSQRFGCRRHEWHSCDKCGQELEHQNPACKGEVLLSVLAEATC